MADEPQKTGRERKSFERLIPESLRARFLVILFGVLLPSLTLFGVLHHDLVKRALLNDVDQTLNNRSLEIEKASRAWDPSTGPAPQESLSLTAAPEVMVEIINSEGKVVWQSSNLQGRLLPLEKKVRTGRSTVEMKDGSRLRRLTRPLRLPSQGHYTVVAAESLAHLDAALQASVGRSVLLGFLILVLTGVLGSWAIQGAYTPLRHLVDTAEQIAITDDVTRRVPLEVGSDDEVRRTAIAFNQLMDRVEHLLEMAKRLLADTSHELRNPLTVLMADLDLLKNELSSEQREEVIDEAQATVKRMTRLVSDLLALARAEAHSEKRRVQEVDVLALARKVAQRQSQAGAKVEVSCRDETPPMASVDRQQTEQILTNLIENGVRYSSEGKVDLTLWVQEPDRVIISVRDYGRGIPPEEQQNIFRRFYRIDRSRDRHSGGTGLGLPLARALARDMGGDITLTSELGKGSEFLVSLPLALGASL